MQVLYLCTCIVIIIDEKLIFAKRIMIFCSIGSNGLIPLTRTQTLFSIQQKYESFKDLLLTLREIWVFLKKASINAALPLISLDLKKLKAETFSKDLSL